MIRQSIGNLCKGGSHELYGKPSEDKFIQPFEDVDFPLDKIDIITEKLSKFRLPVKVQRYSDTDSIMIFLELGKSKEESNDDIIEFEKYYESVINEIKK